MPNVDKGERMSAVTYAVRLRVVSKYFGQLALLQALLSFAPLAASLYFREYHLSLSYLAVSALLAAVGLPLARLPEPARVLPSEALVITALAFIATPLVMTIPFTDTGLPFGDALFEAVSAITTTGLSTLATLDHLPQTFLFARAWTQWYGGLGIVVLSLALLAGQGGVARRLIEPETAGEGLASTVRSHAQRVLLVYLALTVLGIVAVWVAGVHSAAGVDHVLAAVSTGGFSSFDTSLAGFASGKVTAVIMALSVCGAIGLPLYYRAWHAGPGALWRNPELRALVFALTLVVAMLTVLMVLGERVAWPQALRRAAVLGVSAQTTTGFSDSPISALGNASLLVLIVAMMVGGCVGSTAGGVKLLRVLFLLRAAHVAIRRTGATSHAVIEPMLEGRRIEDADLGRALLLMALYCVVVLLSWFTFLAYGYAPMHSLFEVASATATVGLSTGLTSPTLEPTLKAVLGLDMLLGRLEIVALLVTLYPGTWIGNRDESL
jgi:trk system potassium uptake protein TrkH